MPSGTAMLDVVALPDRENRSLLGNESATDLPLFAKRRRRYFGNVQLNVVLLAESVVNNLNTSI